MKKASVVFASALFLAGTALFGQNVPQINTHTHQYPIRGWARPGGGGGQNLTYHKNGTVIRNAHLVMIFWGPSFGSGGADSGYATTLQNFRNQYGTNPEFNTITQYYGEDAVAGYGNISQSNLAGGTADWFDSSTPPTNVTDSAVQGEVQRYLASHAFDNSAIYEVFIPGTSYSSDGSSTSCGGPSLAYCAYHGYFSYQGNSVKYSIEPYPNCSGCAASGFNTVQNQEHFVCHETREAVTDSLLNAWYDRRGYEADDKCAWSPAPFIDGGYGYQYEWSNADSGCVKTK
ncbi:MAG TPA: hypothetical protein VKH35_07825 [Thermoanaerobaculia bacterium]|nr:hypothetical protein [Thermoanaerobaculia bacterium]